jgi:hypothetical protein
VEAHGAGIVVACQHRRRAIALMHVEIDHRRAPRPTLARTA